ncbi:MAG TPA: hypothetical protein VL069_15610, partial [Opitutus sp.]|nr:hypothetical protein [Opitutus sp.]
MKFLPPRLCSLAAVMLIACGGTALHAKPAGFDIVTRGKPVAVVVTAEKPSATEKYAVQELVHHVEKSTGVKLRVETESAVA